MLSFLSLAALLASATALSTFSPARPPAIPLAVKSPYLSAWLPVNSANANGGSLAGNWPTFWNGQVVGWAGLIRVDGQTYTWMGNPTGTTAVNQTSFEYTATRSIFHQNVKGKINIVVTFLSPITPNDLKRASLVSSYMEVQVSSADGKAHQVELYTDISAEWISGDRSAIAKWDYGSTATMRTGNSVSKGVAYHRLYRQTPLAFSEVNDQTEYGHWYYMTTNTSSLTRQSGADINVRSQFANSGQLKNTADRKFRAIQDNYPVFGFALNLGSIQKTPVSSVFTINLNQDQAVVFEGAQGKKSQPSLWASFFGSQIAANTFFLGDYAQAKTLADQFDNKLHTDSVAAGGANYSLITLLAARQAFGAFQLSGTANQTLAFMKEISSDGNVNTVDVLFPWHPIALYTNPNWLRYALEPLFINQEEGNWPHTFSIHDIGYQYPNATGHNDGNDEQQPLEECGDMIIMSLAYAQRTNDNAWLSKHYALLNKWVVYLIQESLIPQNQISTDDFAGSLANQTNLALKGIIGIQAMAEISNRTGHLNDAANYSSIASKYISQWNQLATATKVKHPHTTLNYGNTSSFSLLYNLFAAPLLAHGSLVPQAVYDRQSAFYPSVANRYGVPLDTRHSYTKLDWQLFCAAVANAATKKLMIDDVARWIQETPTTSPMSDLFDTTSGNFPAGITFRARPVVGGAFALLALPNGSVPA
ncbi:glutaminase GtaA [Myriangium duriaei CBS 260.36]|uniref:Glutaminase GtaA n=1 Tax=Myriangium duriaei CBS 260.36 TaxID=1168546 RepID=A0A9P4IWU8_9PEZI|nr:glutaminase GtaA [Myriangium duriaei CBS 260.36]